MRRRLLIGFPIALVLGAGIAGVSGAFSSSKQKTAVAAVSTTQMSMPMPSAAQPAKGSLTMELHQKVVQVKISNFAFVPARITVSPGTRVEWTNEDSDPHTVTTDSPGWSSQALDTGSHFTEVVTKNGSFPYHCTIHPFMHGTVVVQG